MSRVILTAATAAGQSDDFTVRGVQRAGGNHAHLTAPGIGAGEYGTVQKKNNDDTYTDYYVNGGIQRISNVHTGVVVDAAGIYRIDKDATSGAVGIEISTPDVP